MAFWATEVEPGTPLPLSIERRLVATQAALIIESPSSEPCILSVTIMGQSEYVVCRLREGRAEHCAIELTFHPVDNVTLHLKGPHKLHLTGYLEVEDQDDLNEMDDTASDGDPSRPLPSAAEQKSYLREAATHCCNPETELTTRLHEPSEQMIA